MKFFWPIYLSSLFIGTIGVYVAAPLARPYVSGILGKNTSRPSPAGKADVPFAPLAKPSLPSAAVPPQPAPPVTAPAEESDETPPVLQGINLASRGDKPTWGVTHQRTSYYKTNGARLGHVPGGTLLAFKETRPSSKGAMVACQLLTAASSNDVYLVSSKDVCLFTGSYTQLTPRQIEALKTYYTLNGKISQRKIELLQDSASKNPFFTAYNTAYTVYMAQIDKAKELTVQRDRATGADKSRFEDQLREMKMAETRLKSECEEEHLKFRTWKEQHASELAKPENDPDVKKWTQEMGELRSRIAGLAL